MHLRGIHHITAIATDPQHNLDFYTQILGLRFVKRTVNFDDPGSYHFYFGDRIGTPGTVLTFFPWPGTRRGWRGTGQVAAVAFSVPSSAFDFWKARFAQHHVLAEEIPPRFGNPALRLTDPDGLMLEMIGSARPNDVDLNYVSGVPRNFAIRGFHAPTLEVQSAGLTEQLLTATFGFKLLAHQENRRRFSLGEDVDHGVVDLVETTDGQFGNIAAGTVHHIAFRASNDEEQRNWREALRDLGFAVTRVIDRQYFYSIYFREPGGILFEIATDGPGFMIDEPVEHLGEKLQLPPQYEPERETIARVLPRISMPQPAIS